MWVWRWSPVESSDGFGMLIPRNKFTTVLNGMQKAPWSSVSFGWTIVSF